MKRSLFLAASLIVGAVGGIGIVYVTNTVSQVHHDSCHAWHEPPPWASFCPSSSRHGVR